MPAAALTNQYDYKHGDRYRSPGLGRWFLAALSVIAWPAFAATNEQRCPELQPFYPQGDPAPLQAWGTSLIQLELLLESCLQSAEYFALLGAAQLNTGQLVQALESLERALLIDPQHGAANIDYAEALFLAGQLFPALEINAALLARSDLPTSLRTMVEARQQQWQQQTHSRQLLLETTAGYDNNLNGAPTRSDLTLTFGGVPLSFTLDSANQPLQGSFANLRLGGAWQWTAPTQSHALVATGRIRQAFAGDADLAQVDWRYTYALPSRQARWELGVGTSHMWFGGSPLYSVADFRARAFWGKRACRPNAEAGWQHLNYHGQTLMNGQELSLSGGYTCQLANDQLLQINAGWLTNAVQGTKRPGGDRQGWNLRLNWQMAVGKGDFSSQIGYARLHDERGYSALLGNGAKRNVGGTYLNFRYQYPLADSFNLVINLSHQRQHSNLQPFENRGTAAEVGLSLDF